MALETKVLAWDRHKDVTGIVVLHDCILIPHCINKFQHLQHLNNHTYATERVEYNLKKYS